MSILTVDCLTKYYGDFKAVDNLSFKIKEGEVFGIMGPNGAGKSSTLEAILGTKSKDSGIVEILGMDPISRRSELFNLVGVQFQDSAYQTGIKVYEICEVISSLYRDVDNYKDLLFYFGLERESKSLVSNLSGGQRQRLSILLACLHRPKLLFLDELTTGLDPVARRQTWSYIERLNSSGTTVVLTSHYMDEVEALCSRACIIQSGKIKAIGTIDELKGLGRSNSLEESYINIIRGEINESISNHN